MKVQDFDKIIRETNACDNSTMAESLIAKHPEVFDNREDRNRRKAWTAKKRFAIFAPPVAAVCLASILIPCILLTGGSDSSNNDSENYYCYAGEYSISFSDKTLKEISMETGGGILFFDWYDVGSDCVTSIYNLNDTDVTICVNESIYNLETDDYIELNVSPSKYILDIFSVVLDSCVDEIMIDNVKVKYSVDATNSYGIITYNSYTYYLTLMYNSDAQRLFSLIEELLP